MDLVNLYNNLYRKAITDIQNGKNEIDLFIGDPNDQRRGLTVLLRPNESVKNRIVQFQDQLSQIDNEQYYQPVSDMHVTVLSIISCRAGFELEQIDLDNYISIFKESTKNIKDISLYFRGISASSEALMIQGFPASTSLEQLRHTLRVNFKKSQLHHTMDQRYILTSAHITAARFRQKIKQPDQFAKTLNQYRKFDFGTSKSHEIELVYNDWYQRSQIVKVLHKVSL